MSQAQGMMQRGSGRRGGDSNQNSQNGQSSSGYSNSSQPSTHQSTLSKVVTQPIEQATSVVKKAETKISEAGATVAAAAQQMATTTAEKAVQVTSDASKIIPKTLIDPKAAPEAKPAEEKSVMLDAARRLADPIANKSADAAAEIKTQADRELTEKLQETHDDYVRQAEAAAATAIAKKLAEDTVRKAQGAKEKTLSTVSDVATDVARNFQKSTEAAANRILDTAQQTKQELAAEIAKRERELKSLQQKLADVVTPTPLEGMLGDVSSDELRQALVQIRKSKADAANKAIDKSISEAREKAEKAIDAAQQELISGVAAGAQMAERLGKATVGAIDQKAEGLQNSLEKHIRTMDEQITALMKAMAEQANQPNVNNELEMVRLQQLLSQRQLAVQLTTQMMQQMQESTKEMAKNVKP